MAAVAFDGHVADMDIDAVSPTDKRTMAELPEPPIGPINSVLVSRVDPDAQTTVTDFLDFTEYLPADITRSLTLIGKLDQTYVAASAKVNDLTTTWGQLPSIVAHKRPSAVQLRAEISEQLNQALSSRVYAHAEAVRMTENVNRHYSKANILLAKLKKMMENYPTDDEQQLAAESRSPQMLRAKLGVRVAAEDGQKVRRPRVPRITVPGEVLAPYDIEYDTLTGESDSSSEEESDIVATNRRTPGTVPRIKLVSSKSQKSASRPARPVPYPSAALSAAAAANAAALLHPPPENAVVGSSDAPWLQLTQYELAKLRKRMKKNATWTPSETMIARELKALCRGPDAYREAKKKAEEEGRVFDPKIPSLIIDGVSGAPQLPAGAISVDSLAADDVPTSNRGMKLNEAKKLKREQLAKLAAEEAEESARKMAQAAKLFLGVSGASNMSPEAAKDSRFQTSKPRTNSRSQPKRKRDADGDTSTETIEATESPSKPPAKRSKMETPVPHPYQPNQAQSITTALDSPAPGQIAQTPVAPTMAPQLETPVPIPIPSQGASLARLAVSPAPATPQPVPGTNTVATSISAKPPASETPVPLPKPEQKISTTPIPPPVRETPAREAIKRETRGEAAKRTQQQSSSTVTSPQQTPQTLPDQENKPLASRGPTPRTTPAPEGLPLRRPSSRGKAMSQEPQPSLAADRPRRASTARNTPVPETRIPPKRPKRPAPGVVSITSSGGTSAVGKRKAAPKRKPRAMKKEKGQVTEVEMEEVDDEGNPIDPNEPRYCLCNNVSFGTMIQCDNVDVSNTPGLPIGIQNQVTNCVVTHVQNCKYEWFHIGCVGLSSIPARTTKWYCPDCRKLLNIGEKGEINARGVKK